MGTLRPKRTLRPIIRKIVVYIIIGSNVRFGRNVHGRIVFGRNIRTPVKRHQIECFTFFAEFSLMRNSICKQENPLWHIERNS